MAALILFHFAGRAYYFYGMSRDLHRNLMPTHLLQWEAMRWARAQGCTVYDMWGAPDTLDESDPMWGVYRFKQGFGGQFVQHIGAWDYADIAPTVLALHHRYAARPRPDASPALASKRQAARSIKRASCLRCAPRAANRSGIHSR